MTGHSSQPLEVVHLVWGQSIHPAEAVGSQEDPGPVLQGFHADAGLRKQGDLRRRR
jgi:hypothetical protein